ncbi:MAG: ribonuclease [Patescibacteria group bacterium]|nr:ribonuclease [Patescibacteria group bacterium]
MDTTSIGRKAEQQAAKHLKKKYRYKLLENNWRTKACENDHIMLRGKTIHFIEVKYRKNTLAGSGLDSISPKKLHQMYKSALIWIQSNPEYQDFDINIAALEMTDSGGRKPAINFIPSISYDIRD